MATERIDVTAAALELFARGYVDSRIGGIRMAREDPAFVASLLALPPGPEMRHPDDRADPQEWGGCG